MEAMDLLCGEHRWDGLRRGGHYNEYGASLPAEADVVPGRAGASSGDEKYDICDASDVDAEVLGANKRLQRRRLALLHALHEEVQFPPAGQFDKDNIA
jgi:hypothetical protein